MPPMLTPVGEVGAAPAAADPAWNFPEPEPQAGLIEVVRPQEPVEDLPLSEAAAETIAPVTPATPELPQVLVTGTRRKDAVEQYRKLAATLHQAQSTRGTRVVVCTSAAVAEGKTVTACNVALTLSQSYQRRVLLIDADMRRPKVHNLFNLSNKEGLYEALCGSSDRKIPVNAVTEHLSVLTAGRPGPDPVHVLTSERLTRVLEDAGSTFDWVIIDTPPVLLLPDAGLLMNMVDAALLVVAAGTTTYRMAKKAVDALGRERILGVVMNRADDSVLQAGYGSYYGYYGEKTV
jgi:capsular exopolysaccharide synthesis family protein